MATTTPTLIARIVTDEPVVLAARPKRRVGHRIIRGVSTVLMGTMLAFLAFMGSTGGGQPAGAVPIVDDGPFCAKENPGPYSFGSGTSAMVPTINAVSGLLEQASANAESWEGRQVTAYEWYGVNGLVWSQYEDDCWSTPFRWFGSTIGNVELDVAKGITTMSIGMYQWASSPDLLGDFLGPVDAIINGSGGGQGLKDTLYLNFLTPIIVMGALWGGWQGLVKKRSTEAMQGGIWMIASACFALVFMAQPSAIANWTNSIVSTVNSTAMSAVTSSAANVVGDADMCALDSGAESAGVRMASCSIYKALLYTPWASGQFGTGLNTPLPDATDQEKARIGNRTFDDLRIAQLEAQAINHEEARQDWEGVNNADDARWTAIKTLVDGQKGKYNWSLWAGEQPSDRLQIGFAAVIASITAGALILVISFSIIVLSLGMLLLVLMSPLFFLIGAHPGFGRGIALKWLELLLGTVLKRIVLGFMLAVLIGFYQVILATPMAWFSQVVLLLAVGIGAMIYRKPMLEAMNIINLGGSRSGIEESPAKSIKRGAAGGVGAIAGGVLGAKGGGVGGALQGAFQGGLSGSRTGSPMRAGSQGAGAGRRVAGRAQAKSAAEEAAEKKRLAEEAAANDPFSYDKDRRKEATEERRIQDMVDKYQDDPEMRRRLEDWAAKKGRNLPPPRPKNDPIPGLPPVGGGAGAGVGAGVGAVVGSGMGGAVTRPSVDPGIADTIADIAENTQATRDEARATREAQNSQGSAISGVKQDVTQVKNATDIAQAMLRKVSSERKDGGMGGTGSGGSRSGGTPRPGGK